MSIKKRSLLICCFFLILAAFAWLSTGKNQGENSCALDGTGIIPISRVTLTQGNGEITIFCSLCCAHTWLEDQPGTVTDLQNKQASLTVVDEISGLEVDASLAYWIESEEYSRQENRCRVHIFSDKQRASKYLRKNLGQELPGYLAGLGKKLSWAADFSLPNMYGRQQSLSEFRGKVVFLRFWSTKNPFVATDLKNLQEAQERFSTQNFTVLAVNVEDTKETVSKLLKELEITFPVLLDLDGKVADSYLITGFPTGYLLDRSGIVDSSSIGEVNADLLTPFLHGLQ